MLNRRQGFTVIELAIIVAIVGIMAALAVAAYQTYTVRAQIADGIAFASASKLPVIEAYENSRVAPANRVASGLTPIATDSRGSFVSALDISNGRIDITFGGPLVHQDIIGATISLTPYEAAGNIIQWRCGFAPAPEGKLLNGGSPHQPPTVQARYLPARCRS